MKDSIVRAISRDGLISALAIDSKNTAERARRIHKALPIAAAALGRSLSAASMIGLMQKVEDSSVTLQIKGGGPLGTILCVSDSHGNVRGYVQNPGAGLIEKYKGKLDVGAAVGNCGSLTLIRDLKLKEPYVGSVALVSGEIAEDVAAYFAESEQIPTVCALGVLIDTDMSVKASGGYIIQLLPGAGEELIDRLEQAVAGAGPVTALYEKGMSPEGVIKCVLADFDMEILEKSEIEYRCYCSREKVTRVLISLGIDELQSIADEQEEAEIECQFCDTLYSFGREEILELVTELHG